MKTLIHYLAVTTIAGFIPLGDQALADPVYRLESPLTPHATTTVRAADLDLTNPEDVQLLYQRIRGAARSLCEVEHSAPWDIKRTLHARECFEQAVDRAVARANAPALTALHRADERVVRR